MCLLFLHHELRVLSEVDGSVGQHGTRLLEFLDLKKKKKKHFRDKVFLEKCHGLFLVTVNYFFPLSRPIAFFFCLD